MAFVCPPKCKSEQSTDTLKELKHLVAKLEDQLTPGAEPTCFTPMAHYCMPCCPPTSAEPPLDICNPPDCMLCYKVKCSGTKPGAKATAKAAEKVHAVHTSKSRELRMGILYSGCDCEKLNGLQDSCPRSGCLGRPECLTKPPTCGPSEYSNAKHLGKKQRNFPKAAGQGKEGGETEGGEKFVFKCFPAKIKMPDQKICLVMPPCPAPCCMAPLLPPPC